MNSKVLSKVISGAILCSMMAYVTPVFGYTKEETVYSKADSSGNTYKTIVSEHLQNTDKDQELTDFSDLLNITNTKGEETFTQDGNKIVWAANGNDIYYQGDTQKELPIKSEIKYELNGKEVSSDEIKGKSGNVKITINYTNNEKRNVKVNGQDTEMYVPFVVVAGTIFNNDNNSNIEVTNGKAIDDGSKTTVMGMAMPGLQESLDVSKDTIDIPSSVEITMDTTNFEQNNIISYATAKVFDESDLKMFDKMDEIYSDVDTLQSSMDQIQAGAEQLNDGTHRFKREVNSKVSAYTNLRNQYSKTDIMNQISRIVNQKVNEMLPGVQARAKAEAQSVVKEHENELVNSTVDTAIDLTNKATAEKIAQIAQGKDLLTTEQKQALQQEITKDVKAAMDSVQVNNPQLTAALTATMKAEAQKTVDSKIDSMTNMDQQTFMKLYGAKVTSLTQTYMTAGKTQAEAQALAVKDVQDIAGVTVNATKTQVDSAINNATFDDTTKELQKEMNTYVANVKQELATQLISQGTSPELLNTITNAYKAQILDAVRTQLVNDKTLQNAIKSASQEDIAKITEATAQKLANQYTVTLTNEVTNNIIESEFSANNANSMVNQELSKYEGTINNALDKADSGVAELQDALDQLSNGSEQLTNGIKTYNEEGIHKISDLVNGDVKGITERVKALRDIAKDYNSFTMLDEGNEGTTEFITVVDAIKADDDKD